MSIWFCPIHSEKLFKILCWSLRAAVYLLQPEWLRTTSHHSREVRNQGVGRTPLPLKPVKKPPSVLVPSF
jgi:hypothetical protein